MDIEAELLKLYEEAESDLIDLAKDRQCSEWTSTVFLRKSQDRVERARVLYQPTGKVGFLPPPVVEEPTEVETVMVSSLDRKRRTK